MIKGFDKTSEAGLIRQAQLLVNNYLLRPAGFIMRVTRRGSAGKRYNAKDISGYVTKCGGPDLSVNLITDRTPGRFEPVGSDVKKGISACKSRILQAILIRPARLRLNLSLYFPG